MWVPDDFTRLQELAVLIDRLVIRHRSGPIGRGTVAPLPGVVGRREPGSRERELVGASGR